MVVEGLPRVHEWISVKEVAALFGISEWTVYNFTKRPDPMPHGRVGRRIVFNKAEIESWVRRQQRQQLSPPPSDPEAPDVVPVVPVVRPGPKRRADSLRYLLD